MQIIVLGLRRSGTTIFWQTLRQDPRLTCFNEPFNPWLRDLPAEIPNRSRAEMIDVYEKDPAAFRRHFAPIGRSEELQEGFADRQAAYLRFLLDQAPSVALDTTRCHFKIEALAGVAPAAVLVHLYRHPAAVASSHLIPSGSGGRRAGRIRQARARWDFWSRSGRYNNWGVEELVGAEPRSLFGRRLAEIGLDPEAVYRQPAVGKLLAWWRLGWERAERDGPRVFGERFVSVSFEEFCADPTDTVARVYRALGEASPELDVTGVRPPHAAHQPQRDTWLSLYRDLGLSGAMLGEA